MRVAAMRCLAETTMRAACGIRLAGSIARSCWMSITKRAVCSSIFKKGDQLGRLSLGCLRCDVCLDGVKFRRHQVAGGNG